MTVARWAFLAACLAGAGCGGQTESHSTGSGGSVATGGSGGSVATGGSGGSVATGGGAGTGGSSGACAAIAAEIAKQTQIVGSTSVLVRLDYQTLKVLGHAFIPGSYAQVDEPAARQVAQADTGYGDGQLLSGPMPQDEWVFYTAPGDFGGASAVSARTGLTVFGGSIIWMGKGEIAYPKTWDTSDLGSGCPATGPAPSARGIDLGSGVVLDQTQVDAATQVVWQTAVPAGLWQWGYVFDVMVLMYPRTVGMLDPSTAEYVVIVNGGWLE